MRRSADDVTGGRGGGGGGGIHSDCLPEVEGRKWKQGRNLSYFRRMMSDLHGNANGSIFEKKFVSAGDVTNLASYQKEIWRPEVKYPGQEVEYPLRGVDDRNTWMKGVWQRSKTGRSPKIAAGNSLTSVSVETPLTVEIPRNDYDDVIRNYQESSLPENGGSDLLFVVGKRNFEDETEAKRRQTLSMEETEFNDRHKIFTNKNQIDHLGSSRLPCDERKHGNVFQRLSPEIPASDFPRDKYRSSGFATQSPLLTEEDEEEDQAAGETIADNPERTLDRNQSRGHPPAQKPWISESSLIPNPTDLGTSPGSHGWTVERSAFLRQANSHGCGGLHDPRSSSAHRYSLSPNLNIFNPKLTASIEKVSCKGGIEYSNRNATSMQQQRQQQQQQQQRHGSQEPETGSGVSQSLIFYNSRYKQLANHVDPAINSDQSEDVTLWLMRNGSQSESSVERKLTARGHRDPIYDDVANRKPPKPTKQEEEEVTVIKPKEWLYSAIYEPITPKDEDDEENAKESEENSAKRRRNIAADEDKLILYRYTPSANSSRRNHRPPPQPTQVMTPGAMTPGPAMTPSPSPSLVVYLRQTKDPAKDDERTGTENDKTQEKTQLPRRTEQRTESTQRDDDCCRQMLPLRKLVDKATQYEDLLEDNRDINRTTGAEVKSTGQKKASAEVERQSRAAASNWRRKPRSGSLTQFDITAIKAKTFSFNPVEEMKTITSNETQRKSIHKELEEEEEKEEREKEKEEAVTGDRGSEDTDDTALPLKRRSLPEVRSSDSKKEREQEEELEEEALEMASDQLRRPRGHPQRRTTEDSSPNAPSTASTHNHHHHRLQLPEDDVEEMERTGKPLGSGNTREEKREEEEEGAEAGRVSHVVSVEWRSSEGVSSDVTRPTGDRCRCCHRVLQVPANPALRLYHVTHRCSRDGGRGLRRSMSTSASMFLVDSGGRTIGSVDDGNPSPGGGGRREPPPVAPAPLQPSSGVRLSDSMPEIERRSDESGSRPSVDETRISGEDIRKKRFRPKETTKRPITAKDDGGFQPGRLETANQNARISNEYSSVDALPNCSRSVDEESKPFRIGWTASSSMSSIPSREPIMNVSTAPRSGRIKHRKVYPKISDLMPIYDDTNKV